MKRWRGGALALRKAAIGEVSFIITPLVGSKEKAVYNFRKINSYRCFYKMHRCGTTYLRVTPRDEAERARPAPAAPCPTNPTASMLGNYREMPARFQ